MSKKLDRLIDEQLGNPGFSVDALGKTAGISRINLFRFRVAGLDHPEFSLISPVGRPVPVRAREGEEAGQFVIQPASALPVGVYILRASQGEIRRSQRVLIAAE